MRIISLHSAGLSWYTHIMSNQESTQTGRYYYAESELRALFILLHHANLSEAAAERFIDIINREGNARFENVIMNGSSGEYSITILPE